jgi:hypothetical protein
MIFVQCIIQPKSWVEANILHKCAKGIVDTMVSFGRYAGLRCEAEVNGPLQPPDGLICGLSFHPKLVFDVKVTETITLGLKIELLRQVNLRRTSSLKQRWLRKEHYTFLYQSVLLIVLDVDSKEFSICWLNMVLSIALFHLGPFELIGLDVCRMARRCACTVSCWFCFCFQQKKGSGLVLLLVVLL